MVRMAIMRSLLAFIDILVDKKVTFIYFHLSVEKTKSKVITLTNHKTRTTQ